MEGAESFRLQPGPGGARRPGSPDAGAGPERPGRGRDFRAMFEQVRERTETIQSAATAIADQVLVLKGIRAGREFQEDIAGLQSIVAAATAEQATKTAQLVQGMIDARQKAFQETSERLGIPMRRARPGPGGMRGPRGEPPIKGGFEWID